MVSRIIPGTKKELNKHLLNKQVKKWEWKWPVFSIMSVPWGLRTGLLISFNPLFLKPHLVDTYGSIKECIFLLSDENVRRPLMWTTHLHLRVSSFWLRLTTVTFQGWREKAVHILMRFLPWPLFIFSFSLLHEAHISCLSLSLNVLAKKRSVLEYWKEGKMEGMEKRQAGRHSNVELTERTTEERLLTNSMAIFFF